MNLETGYQDDNNGRQKRKNGGGYAAAHGVIVNGRGGKFARGAKISPMREKFIHELVDNGGKVYAAAKAAGYAHPSQDGWRLMQEPDVREALRARRESILAGDLSQIAIGTLRAVMEDEAAPAAARVSAAKWVLEAGGHGLENRRLALKSIDPDDKPLSERTAAELEEFIARQTAIMDGMRQVSAPVIDVDSSQDVDCEEDAED